MKEFLIYNPGRPLTQQFIKVAVAKKLNEGQVEEYKRLGFAFGCVCRGVDKDADPPEMVWVNGHRHAGTKWVQAHAAAAAGTIDQHAPECDIHLGREDRSKPNQLTLNKKLKKFWPVIAYINAWAGKRYRFSDHQALDGRHDGLGLTRSAPSIETLTEQSNNRHAAFSVKSAQDLVRLINKVVTIQDDLSGIALSQGGGARSLVASYFNPSKAESRHHLRTRLERAWRALGLEQDREIQLHRGQALPKTSESIAFPPLLMRVIPSQRENGVIAQRAEGERIPRGKDRLVIHGSGGTDDASSHPVSFDVICPNITVRNQIESAISNGEPVYIIANPVFTRPVDENEMPKRLRIKMYVATDMVYVGNLPAAVDQALNKPYHKGDWAKHLRTADEKRRKETANTPSGISPAMR